MTSSFLLCCMLFAERPDATCKPTGVRQSIAPSTLPRGSCAHLAADVHLDGVLREPHRVHGQLSAGVLGCQYPQHRILWVPAPRQAQIRGRQAVRSDALRCARTRQGSPQSSRRTRCWCSGTRCHMFCVLRRVRQVHGRCSSWASVPQARLCELGLDEALAVGALSGRPAPVGSARLQASTCWRLSAYASAPGLDGEDLVPVPEE